MKKKFFVFGLIILILFFRFFFGIYEDDEFGEIHIFKKYRPTWHWYFYSPIGQSDKKIEYLSKEEQIEQKYWNEFIERKISLE